MPALRERLHGLLTDTLVAVCRTTALAEGKLDRPGPGLLWLRAVLNLTIRPTMRPPVITSKDSGFLVGCRIRSAIAASWGALVAGQGLFEPSPHTASRERFGCISLSSSRRFSSSSTFSATDV